MEWNSWYNPLDNVANVAKGFRNTLTGGMYGGSTSDPTGGYNLANNTQQQSFNSAFNVPTTSSTPQVKSATTDPGALYFDTNTNQMSSPDGLRADGSAWPTGGSGRGGGGSAPAGPSYDPNELAQYDSAIGLLQGNMNRLPTQSGIAMSNIDNQFNTGTNELNTGRQQAEQSYNQQGVQNSQSLRGSKNAIADQASQGLRGLMRILGAYGAGGSSERGVAGQAVAGQASQQRSGANQVFSSNQQALDTGYGNFKNQEENERKKLNDWRTQQKDSVSQQELSSRQDLLTRLADLTGKRDQYKGGSYQGGAAPFISQAQALNSQIDELGRINPTYTGNTPTYNPQSLDSYSASANQAQTGVNAQQQLNSPYLAMLLGQDDERLRVR